MNEFPVVLVINCGSSSIKFSVLDASSCDVLMAGIADGINSENAFLSINDGEPVKLAHRSYEGALKAIAFELEKRSLIDSVALIGHRIAHGGNIFTESVVITEEVIDNIRRVSPLAPLHNYANLSGIASAQQLFPGVRQVAVFDTSFHQTLAPEAYLYGLPWKYFEELGVRRYGFHGTSHRYVSQRAQSLLALPEADCGLVIAQSGQRGLYLRRAQRTERGYLNGDDAAGRAHDGHPLWRCRLRRHGMGRPRNQPDPQRS